jgi:hypothetical protein
LTPDLYLKQGGGVPPFTGQLNLGTPFTFSSPKIRENLSFERKIIAVSAAHFEFCLWCESLLKMKKKKIIKIIFTNTIIEMKNLNHFLEFWRSTLR